MILNTFTLVHVILSLIGIGAGLVVMLGFLSEKPLGSANTVFLWTTILTDVTGYFFPYHGFKPSYVVGAISLVWHWPLPHSGAATLPALGAKLT